jgi:hypothetical protein
MSSSSSPSPPPSPEKLEPEHPIEQSDVALCVISGQGELRCRDPPIVVNQEKGGSCLVFASFVSLPEEVWPSDVLCMLWLTWKLIFPTGFPTICL